MGPIQSIEEVIDFLRRRAGVIVLVAALGLILSVFVAQRTAHVYQSLTILSNRVDAVADDAVRASSAGAQSRLLQLVEQRLTTSENMLRLADTYGLFTDEQTHTRVRLMRESITLISEAAVTVGFGSDGALASIIIMARADDPDKAADIANQLGEMVIAETGAGRMARARETLEFLALEQTQLMTELRELEAEARAYATQNFDAMPFNATVRRTELTQILSNIQEIRREISAAEAELAGMRDQTVSQRRQVQLRETISARNAELAQLEAQRDATTPFFQRAAQVERDLNAFERAEARLRDRLREVSTQVASAEGALRLETDERSASFEILERAVPAEAPMSRSRRVTVLMGLVAGGILGVLGAFAYEVLRPALRSARQLERETGMRPVLVLPEMVAPSQRRRARLGWIAGAGLLALTLAALMLTQQGS